ncbi:MAG TPA: cob(I)yrinic acid a,c-diamide adenosyltransferase [Bacillota bacterium]|nr:cob(I)yrinic acid a,c-diamide adenosyltransferase [Bacillota bacterium]
MKLYTRTGDQGKTALIGARVDKDNIRVQSYGTVDELNGYIGLAVAQLDEQTFHDVIHDLEKIQHELFDCGADLATVSKRYQLKVTEEHVTYLEKKIDEYTEETPKLERFILPGGAKEAATLHIARTIARRAERSVVTLMKQDETIPSVILQYLNRLSDYLFVAARVVNFRLDISDVEYARGGQVFHTNKQSNDDADQS